MSLRNILNSVLPSLLVASSASVAFAADPAKAPATKPAYPLATCVVSDEKLGGDMGKPIVMQHEGREVQLCCSGCEKDFKKEPAKYMKKLDEAAKRPATQPSKKADAAKHDHQH